MSAGAGTILLASGSPRRREILAAAGLRFRRVASPDVAEVAAGVPGEVAATNAALKCRAACEAGAPEAGELMLGADTIVVLDGEVLGKPRDRGEAAAMLGRLSGRAHRVLTATHLRDREGREAAAVTETAVHVAALAPGWIRAYVSSGEGDDKAGAYGLQGPMAYQVDGIEGCYFNVVGLSPAALRRSIRKMGRDPLDFVRTEPEA